MKDTLLKIMTANIKICIIIIIQVIIEIFSLESRLLSTKSQLIPKNPYNHACIN